MFGSMVMTLPNPESGLNSSVKKRKKPMNCSARPEDSRTRGALNPGLNTSTVAPSISNRKQKNTSRTRKTHSPRGMDEGHTPPPNGEENRPTGKI